MDLAKGDKNATTHGTEYHSGVDGLDEEQQEVVGDDGSCVVVAGPGSGKTRTLRR